MGNSISCLIFTNLHIKFQNSNKIEISIFVDIEVPICLSFLFFSIFIIILVLTVSHEGVFALLRRNAWFLQCFCCEWWSCYLWFVTRIFLVWFYSRLWFFIVFVIFFILIVIIQVIEIIIVLICEPSILQLYAWGGFKVFAFLLYFLESRFGFTESLKHFVDEFEDLLIFEFSI